MTLDETVDWRYSRRVALDWIKAGEDSGAERYGSGNRDPGDGAAVVCARRKMRLRHPRCER
jgi:hypothetical protein